jgi:hypothetical protein
MVNYELKKWDREEFIWNRLGNYEKPYNRPNFDATFVFAWKSVFLQMRLWSAITVKLLQNTTSIQWPYLFDKDYVLDHYSVMQPLFRDDCYPQPVTMPGLYHTPTNQTILQWEFSSLALGSLVLWRTLQTTYLRPSLPPHTFKANRLVVYICIRGGPEIRPLHRDV